MEKWGSGELREMRKWGRWAQPAEHGAQWPEGIGAVEPGERSQFLRTLGGIPPGPINLHTPKWSKKSPTISLWALRASFCSPSPSASPGAEYLENNQRPRQSRHEAPQPFLISCHQVPLTPNKGRRFSSVFLFYIFIQIFFIVCNSSSQMELQLGFGPSDFVSAQPHHIFVVLLSDPPLPKVADPLLLPKLSVQPGRSSSKTAHLSADGDKS